MHARRDALSQFVHVRLGRQPAAEVEKLPDTALGGEVTHHPAEKRPIVTRYRGDVWNRLDKLPGRLAIGSEIVFAAEQVIVDPGDIRRPCVNAGCGQILFGHLRHHS